VEGLFPKEFKAVQGNKETSLCKLRQQTSPSDFGLLSDFGLPSALGVRRHPVARTAWVFGGFESTGGTTLPSERVIPQGIQSGSRN
jgi:hypothetical protein